MCVSYVHSHDAGADDLQVWFLAANEFRGKKTRLINIAAEGCVSAAQAAQNAALFHSWIPGVELFAPAVKKFSQPPRCERFFGENGFNDVDLKAVINAPRIFIAQAQESFPEQFEGPLHWLETGPCTTLARALLKESCKLQAALKQVTIMGGAFEPPGLVGELHPASDKPCAEFNFYHDALAVRTAVYILNEQGVLPRLVPWESCRKVYFSEEELASLRGETSIAEALRQIMLAFFSLHGGDPVPGTESPIYVPADVVAWYASQGLFGECREVGFEIETDPTARLYGASWLDTNAKLRAEVFSVTACEALKTRFLADMGWR